MATHPQIGSLLQRYGPGVSLIRPAWNSRAEPSSTTRPMTTTAHPRTSTSANPPLPNGSMAGDERKPRTGPKQRIDVRSSENSGTTRHAERQDSAGRRESGGDSSDDMSSDADMNTYEAHPTSITPDHAGSALEKHLRSQAPQPSSVDQMQDTEMDDLTRTMAGTSLDFVPRGARKKQKELEKAARSSLGT
ncbi:hypothetical protein QFC20_001575 [Naganishia adeliensis]|uniref:Uncharacterized protein n=1 Tax=Naganishia adeliensis TaxID=92952 RepID=A0ACC2WTR3_9TREE|nr:hypothetical protein QFC20_001575 [Naganishia adeliensis]